MTDPFARSFEGELVGKPPPYSSRSALTSRQRTEIKQKLGEAEAVTAALLRELALEYGVSTTTIRNLKP